MPTRRPTLQSRFITGPLPLVALASITPPAVAVPFFAAPFLSFDTGSSPISVAIGDLNGDGKSDLAVSNYNSNTVSVLLGNDDGSFGVKTDFGAGLNPPSVAIGD